MTNPLHSFELDHLEVNTKVGVTPRRSVRLRERIDHPQARPIFLAKAFGPLKTQAVYIRRGSSRVERSRSMPSRRLSGYWKNSVTAPRPWNGPRVGLSRTCFIVTEKPSDTSDAHGCLQSIAQRTKSVALFAKLCAPSCSAASRTIFAARRSGTWFAPACLSASRCSLPATRPD